MNFFNLGEMLAQRDVEIMELKAAKEKLTKRHDSDMDLINSQKNEIHDLKKKVNRLEKFFMRHISD